MPKKVKMLVPTYLKKFTCLGNECKENCCLNWKIFIDKKTYKKYKKIPKGQFNPLDNKAITINKNRTSAFDYAILNKIERKKEVIVDGKKQIIKEDACPYLTDDNLCSVFQKLGWDYMSDVCKEYPRIVRKINGEYQMGLMVSCEEAARIVLNDMKGLELEVLELDYEEYFDKENTIEVSNEIMNIFYDIRIASLSVLQLRKYTVSERLLILNIFYRDIENYIEQKKDIEGVINISEGIKKMTSDFILSLDNIGEHVFNNLTKENDIQILYAKLIIKILFLSPKISKKNDIMDILFEGLQMLYLDEKEIKKIDKISVNSEIIDRVNSIKDEFMDDFINSSEIQMVLENYLTNMFFTNCVPFSDDGFIKSLFLVAVFYNICKYLMYAHYYKYKSISKDDVISIIRKVTKRVEHSVEFKNAFSEIGSKMQGDDVSKIYNLIID